MLQPRFCGRVYLGLAKTVTGEGLPLFDVGLVTGGCRDIVWHGLCKTS